ncbi:MAG: hypothetical protein U0T84_05200 [Chitinophagales bacterium]
MKLYRNLCEAVAEALVEIFVHRRHAPQVVEQWLQSNKKWGARDRHFIAYTIYESVRAYRRLLFCIDKEQLETIADGRLLIGALFLEQGLLLPEWNDWVWPPRQQFGERRKIAVGLRALREAIPDWLDQLGAEALGTQWDAELAAANIPAKICLRVNTLRSNKEVVMGWLRDNHIGFSETALAGDALVLQERKNVEGWEFYQNGAIEIQDVSSQLVAAEMQLQPGLRVIDACAGAGGKSLHIASMMRNEGELYSFDVHDYKLKELQHRARRAGVRILKTYLTEDIPWASLRETADRVLIDAPCSGLGTLKRHPDLKWKLTPEFIAQMQETQRQVLTQYSALVKPGGLLVYATCSILPSENTAQVHWFLAAHQHFQLVREKPILSCATGYDGFYVAVLQRL